MLLVKCHAAGKETMVLAESNGSLLLDLWLLTHVACLPWKPYSPWYHMGVSLALVKLTYQYDMGAESVDPQG